MGWGGSQTRVIRGGGWSMAIVVEWMGKVHQTGQTRVGGHVGWQGFIILVKRGWGEVAVKQE